jgi:gluconokinase
MVIVIMGVSGCGKSTVGRLLAGKLNWSFFEGDDFHPPENVTKMRAGIPLADADRRPWLEALRALISRVNREGESAVLACSALKRSYRDQLREAAGKVVFVYLKGTYDLIWQRMESRAGHYMPVRLLRSQFEDLEEPKRAIVVEITQRPEDIIEQIREALSERGETGPAVRQATR